MRISSSNAVNIGKEFQIHITDTELRVRTEQVKDTLISLQSVTRLPLKLELGIYQDEVFKSFCWESIVDEFRKRMANTELRLPCRQRLLRFNYYPLRLNFSNFCFWSDCRSWETCFSEKKVTMNHRLFWKYFITERIKTKINELWKFMFLNTI